MADQSKRVEFRSGNREGFILLPPEGKLVVRDRSTDVDGVTITKDAILGPDGTPLGGGAAALEANGKGFVFHGDDANVERPTGFASVEWHGSVEPNNAVDNDTWIDTSA